MTLKANDITALIELFATSGWDELHVEAEGLQLFLSTDPNARLVSGAQPATAAASFVAAPSASVAVAAATPSAAAPPPAKTAPQANWTAVKAPNLGTFYRSPKPGAPPLVEIGDSIDAETEICLLEVMKLFTAVKSGVAGIVRQACVPDGELVEAEQILFYIEQA